MSVSVCLCVCACVFVSVCTVKKDGGNGVGGLSGCEFVSDSNSVPGDTCVRTLRSPSARGST